MTSACDTFFSLPELISALAPFLSRTDLIRLALTNRTIHTICIPHFWQSLDLNLNLNNQTFLTRLLDSPERLIAFARNIDFVRTIAWGPEFSWYYFHALWTYFKMTPLAPAHQAIPTDALSHKDWGDMSSLPVLKLTPLPPLLRLTRITTCLTGFPMTKLRPESSAYDRDKHLHWNLWLVRLNSPTLTHLECTQLSLESPRTIRDLCRTISQLPHLRTLRLEAQTNLPHTRQTLETLFFSCPGSLVDLDVRRMALNMKPAVYIGPVVNDWDFGQGPLVLRTAPLLHFKRLSLPAMTRLDVAPVIKAFLEHCPAIEFLEVPYLGSSIHGIGPVIESLGELCPFISNLSFPQGCSGEYLMRIMEVLPVERLKSLCSRYVSGLNTERMIAALTLHSSTLQRIELTQSAHVASAIIRTILTTCGALEVLSVTGRQDLGGISLSLMHAVENEWICARIRHLQIGIETTPDGKTPKYMADTSKETWTTEDHRHWEDLGRLYTQIGSLTRLEVLDLKAVRPKGNLKRHALAHIEDFGSPSETCFPGLLALEDSSQGQIGYLSTLAGLTRLRELRGSFIWTNADVMARLGEREVEWFVTNLPALKVATFMRKVDSSPLRMLQARRSRLKICG